MATQNLTCKQRDFLINILRNIPCDESSATVPSGFNMDPESEVIFDPENEVIFDPENEVIFDPREVFNPGESQHTLDPYKNIYNCYGYRINILESKMQVIKLLYYLVTYELKENIIRGCST